MLAILEEIGGCTVADKLRLENAQIVFAIEISTAPVKIDLFRNAPGRRQSQRQIDKEIRRCAVERETQQPLCTESRELVYQSVFRCRATTRQMVGDE